MFIKPKECALRCRFVAEDGRTIWHQVDETSGRSLPIQAARGVEGGGRGGLLRGAFQWDGCLACVLKLPGLTNPNAWIQRIGLTACLRCAGERLQRPWHGGDGKTAESSGRLTRQPVSTQAERDARRSPGSRTKRVSKRNVLGAPCCHFASGIAYRTGDGGGDSWWPSTAVG